MRRWAHFGLALSLCASAAPALAQAYQCRMPERVSVPQVRADGATRQMPVTGYTVALSWSPEFCKNRSGRASHRTQCSGRNGRFGLVMHGLWPDGRGTGSNARWPQWCPTARSVTPAEARRNMCMMPSARLVAKQWAKHGACMARRPETYFRISRIFYNALAKPDFDRLSRQDGLTAGDVRGALATVNNGLEPEDIGIKLNRRGWLEEVRICLNRRFRPTRCDRGRLGARDNVPAKIWRGM